MKQRILIFIIALFAFSAQAQPPQPDISDARREKFVGEIRQYKHDYIAKELMSDRAFDLLMDFVRHVYEVKAFVLNG